MNQKQQERNAQWRRIVADQESSEQSIRDFCRQRGINEHSFYTWRARLREQPVSFALVDTRSDISGNRPTTAGSVADQRIEILLGGGERLQIAADAAILHLVLRTLRELAQ